MKLYRIASEKFIDDMSGSGSRLYGGRWNEKGIALIYTAESRALAALEVLVNASMNSVPLNLKIAEFIIPDDIDVEQVDVTKLPARWSRHPSPASLKALGSEWARSQSSLLLKVPSAIIKEENNLLINPLHKDMNKVYLNMVQDFAFDDRLKN